jgi:hypothetical protein
MADNLHQQGLTTARFDRDQDLGKGTLCRLRGGSAIRGEIVQLDIGATDADTTQAIIGGVDIGTEDGTTDSGHMATVIPVPDTTAVVARCAIYGVVNSAGTTADNGECRVIFGTGMGVFVRVLVADAIDEGDTLVVDSHTLGGGSFVGAVNDAGTGKVVAYATATVAAGGTTVLTTVLWNGVQGYGSNYAS